MGTIEKTENEKLIDFQKEIALWLSKFYDFLEENGNIKESILRNTRYLKSDDTCEAPAETADLLGELLELDYTIQNHREAFGIFMKQNLNETSYLKKS